MTTAAYAAPVQVCAALADDTRWTILQRVGVAPASASELARELPVSRQAIARHLGVLEEVGLVAPVRAGRELRYQALGAPLERLARDLDNIARTWDQRLSTLARLAEARAHGGPQDDLPIAP